ncbi:MAG: hypothetical protein JWL90_1997 [Chthoniobacteraceae bacterium]|nr:hypothetical protein [Chthoniobacteraceae bacterium]
MGKHFRRQADSKFLKLFGQLAGDANWPGRKMRRADFQRFDEPIRRLEKNGGLLAGICGEKQAFALAAFCWQKSPEMESLGWEPGTNERGQDRRRPGQDGVGNRAFDARPQEPMPRIGNARHARIGDDGDLFSQLEAGKQFLGPARFVMSMIAQKRLFDLKMTQQIAGVPGIFRRDDVDKFEGLKRPQRDVPEIADRRGNEVKHDDLPAFAKLADGADGEIFGGDRNRLALVLVDVGGSGI